LVEGTNEAASVLTQYLHEKSWNRLAANREITGLQLFLMAFNHFQWPSTSGQEILQLNQPN
jgi:hypothetical protein